jgi:hypothetical protein
LLTGSSSLVGACGQAAGPIFALGGLRRGVMFSVRWFRLVGTDSSTHEKPRSHPVHLRPARRGANAHHHPAGTRERHPIARRRARPAGAKTEAGRAAETARTRAVRGSW